MPDPVPYSGDELYRRAVMNARPHGRLDKPRWVTMMHTFGCGSTVARAICADNKLDPDEMLKSTVESDE